jgi:hypothetical protein
MSNAVVEQEGPKTSLFSRFSVILNARIVAR